MNERAPFTPEDLAELDERILRPAKAVIQVREAFTGNHDPRAVVLRHDVDDNEGAFDCALRLARWEAARGYRSTYYLLHTARYWDRPGFAADVRELAALGHEVGIHADAIGAVVRRGWGDAHAILAGAIAELRASGVAVNGVAAHGAQECRNEDGSLAFVNDELFAECPRPGVGEPTRVVRGIYRLDPRPLASHGLSYAAERASWKTWRMSDSGGTWTLRPFAESALMAAQAGGYGQLHFLMHPDWWTQAV